MQDDITRFVEKATGEEFTWDLFLQSRLAASRSNGHPSAALHRMAAQKLFAYLQSEGVIESLVEQE